MVSLRFAGFLISFIAVYFSVFVSAGAGPTDMVVGAIQDLQEVHQRPGVKDAEKLQAAKAIIWPRVDFREISKRVLGKHFNAYEDRYLEFTLVFERFMEKKVLPLSGKIKNVSEVQPISENIFVDQAEVGVLLFLRDEKTGERDTVNIYFSLHRVDGVWKMYNFVSPFGSFVFSYRGQTDKVLRDNKFDFDAVIRAYRNR